MIEWHKIKSKFDNWWIQDHQDDSDSVINDTLIRFLAWHEISHFLYSSFHSNHFIRLNFFVISKIIYWQFQNQWNINVCLNESRKCIRFYMTNLDFESENISLLLEEKWFSLKLSRKTWRSLINTCHTV
jgi:hypothetical protein